MPLKHRMFLFILISIFLVSCEQNKEVKTTEKKETAEEVNPNHEINPAPEDGPPDPQPKIVQPYEDFKNYIEKDLNQIETFFEISIKGNLVKNIDNFFSNEEDTPQIQMIKKFKSFSNQVNDNEDKDEDFKPEDISKLFNIFFENDPLVENFETYDTYTYLLNDSLCTEHLAKNNPEVCQGLIPNAKIIITKNLNNSEQKLEFNYTNLNLFKFEIDDNNNGKITFEFFTLSEILRAINNLALEISPNEYDQYLPSINGKFAFNSNSGEETKVFSIDIIEDIHFTKPTPFNTVDTFYLGKNIDWIKLTMDTNLTIDLNLGLFFNSKYNSVPGDDSYEVENFYVDQFVGSINFNNDESLIKISNLGPGTNFPIFYSKGNYETKYLYLNPLNFDITVGEVIEVKALSGNFIEYYDYDQTSTNAQLFISYTEDLKFNVEKNYNEQNHFYPIFRVLEGTLTIEGYDNLSGLIDAPQNTCFMPNEDEENTLDLAIIECPN